MKDIKRLLDEQEDKIIEANRNRHTIKQTPAAEALKKALNDLNDRHVKGFLRKNQFSNQQKNSIALKFVDLHAKVNENQRLATIDNTIATARTRREQVEQQKRQFAQMTADDQFNELKEKLLERRKAREKHRSVQQRLIAIRKSQVDRLTESVQLGTHRVKNFSTKLVKKLTSRLGSSRRQRKHDAASPF